MNIAAAAVNKKLLIRQNQKKSLSPVKSRF